MARRGIRGCRRRCDEIWVRLAGWACGQADRSRVGVADQHGAGLPDSVWWDPARSAVSICGSVELRRAGGDLPRPGCRDVVAGDRGRSGTCPVDDQPGGRRNGGRRRYRAATGRPAGVVARHASQGVQAGATRCCVRIVGEQLKQTWSPQQIAGWLKATYPDDPEMQVSHETIYRTLFIQSRGALRKELTAHLRTGRVIRRPQGSGCPTVAAAGRGS